MEIGETGEHGQAAVGAVVLVSKLVLDNAIILLRKTVEEIAVAALKQCPPATKTFVRGIRLIAALQFIVFPVDIPLNLRILYT